LDAWAAVRPDAAADVVLPALTAVQYVERLAAPARDAQAPDAELQRLPAEVTVLCRPDEAPSAA